MVNFVLTDEGRKYLRNGIPEKNLVKLLKERGPVQIQEAEKEIDNFNVALLWAKKKGWVEIKFNQVVLLKEPERFEEEEGLKKIENDEDVDAKILKILVERKLVEKAVSGKVDKLVGKEVASISPELIKTGIWKKVKFKAYEADVPVPRVNRGRLHCYRQFLQDLKEKLIGLGFVEAEGPLVETIFWNCSTLFMPSDHPSSSIHDIFFVKEPKFVEIEDKELWKRVELTHRNGWKTGSKGWGLWNQEHPKRLILRSHGTAVSSRTLSKLKKKDLPYKMFFIGKCFRPDVIDAKHFVEFDQCEGIVVCDGLNLRHLLGYLKEIAACAGMKKVKFKPSYFPFTEPSVEMYAWINSKWIEVAGAGIFRPEVTLPLGVDVPVLAWGIGIGRLAMMKIGLDDIRDLHTDSLRLLSEKWGI